jgi:hypothetical protein
MALAGKLSCHEKVAALLPATRDFEECLLRVPDQLEGEHVRSTADRVSFGASAESVLC